MQVQLSLPGQPNLPNDPIVAAFLGAYDSKSVFEYNLPSTPGTQTVDFGTMPAGGAKAYLLYYVPVAGGAPSILVTRNAGSHPEEVSNGGFLAAANPVPSVGITSMSIAFTGVGKVQLWLLG
jgi:hypothetical protein